MLITHMHDKAVENCTNLCMQTKSFGVFIVITVKCVFFLLTQKHLLI